MHIIKLVLKHNLFISKLIIKIKFLGIHIELNDKDKKHPSDKE
ncbi:membrane protein [Clostridium botulinum C/D str. BKT2873]|nr:membrane protein [Clostridium botulinum C/D str. BKT75002]KEI11347.1 membrane protein [Clostridium botulinum C/D str. BKT2873]